MATQIILGRNDSAPIAVNTHQAIVWIDTQEARIMHVQDGIHYDSTIRAPDALHNSTGHNGK